MIIYHNIANKAAYIADVARDIASNGSTLTITEQSRAADILRQLQNIADALEEIAPAFQTTDD